MKILALDPGSKASGWALSEIETGTIRAAGIAEMQAALKELIFAMRPDVLAVEDFNYEPWRRRQITTETDMGKILGYLQAVCEQHEIDYYLFAARDTKANMYRMRREFNNDHEFSAYCVLNYARGYLKLADKAKEARHGPTANSRAQTNR